MNATDLLAVPLDAPEKVFVEDAEVSKAMFRKLAAQWHPDRGGDSAVFAHIQVLYEAAQERIAKNEWRTPGLLKIQGYEIRYRMARPFDLGISYIGNKYVTYVFDEVNSDLYDQAVAMIKSLHFPTPAIKKDASSAMPEIIRAIKLPQHSRMLALAKTHDMLCLRDVVNHFGGKLPPVHVAWIVSRLYASACYLQLVGKMMHGDVSLDSYFVHPAEHRGALLGGWWAAQALGRPVKALPARSLGLGLGAGKATHTATATLIRALGVELLGGIGSGSNLLLDTAIPKPMLLWLRGAGTEDAMAEFSQWNKVLDASFGKRKFHKMELDAELLYNVEK